MIPVGTSSYDHGDRMGPVDFAGGRAVDSLAAHADEFGMVELASTKQRQPEAGETALLRSRVRARCLSLRPLELAEWLPKIEEMDKSAPLTLLCLCNTSRAEPVESARMLRRMMAIE